MVDCLTYLVEIIDIPYFLIVIIAALIWAGVIIASYFALTLNMKFATIPFEKLEEVLVDINNGEYTPMQVPEKLNFPEFRAVLTKVDETEHIKIK